MQTIVLKVSLTFDPMALVAWAKAQKGVCCDTPAHDAHLLDWMEPELTAQGILAHAFLHIVPDEITDGGSVETLETGVPPEMIARIKREYQAAFTEMMPTCEDCERRPATQGYVVDPYAAEILGDDTKKWRCSACYNNALEEI